MRFELFVFVFFILLLSRLLYAELFAQAFHSLACSALEVLEVLSAYAHRRFGVDEVYGCRGAHIVDKARSRVYVERCAYNDEDVGLLCSLCRNAYHRHRFAEEYYEWAFERSVAGECAGFHLAVVLGQSALVAWVVHVA